MKIRTVTYFLAVFFTWPWLQTEAVSLSEDGTGQVLIFPLFSVEGSNQTELTIRNNAVTGKALRIVAKDPVNGRPILSLNLYLKPRDGWTGRLKHNFETATAPILTTNDESCTFPEIPPSGIAATDQFLNEDLGQRQPKRLQFGFIEVYEMGEVDTELAGDCDAVNARWGSGVWESGNLTELRNEGLTPPAGGLSGLIAIKSIDTGRSFQLEPLVLDRFMTTALHIHPDWPVRPSLMDVRPATAEIFMPFNIGDLSFRALQSFTFSSTPVHAVDALLMTPGIRTDYHSEESALASSTVLVTMPTRPYHGDNGGFYLRGRGRIVEPFQTSTPLLPGESVDDDLLLGRAVNDQGSELELVQSPGATACGSTEATVNAIALANRLNFSRICDLGEAELFIPDGDTRGEISLRFSGQITSNEGEEFHGLPVVAYLIQDTVGRSVTGSNPVFARAVRVEPQQNP